MDAGGRHLLCVLLLASQALTTTRALEATRIAWADIAPIRHRLEAAGITSATFDAYVKQVRESNSRRVLEGDLDHLVFYLLQSTRFTSVAPIEPALSAKALVDALDPVARTAFLRDPLSAVSHIAAGVRSRISALLRALDTPGRDARLGYFRALVEKVFPDRGRRDAALAGEYLRAMKFLYEKEFVAERSASAREAVADLYRTRGLSTDTAVEAGFLVHQGLGVVRALDPERRIRRVLIVGPGLDLAPRTSLLEAGPPESYQPWAVIDALLAAGLSAAGDLEVVAADINPRVVEHLSAAHRQPPTLTLVSEIRESDAVTLTDEYREYFAHLGRAAGTVERGPALGRGRLTTRVRVRADVARSLRAEALDVVTERLPAPAFDLIVATNILPYFDDVQLMLALSNIAAMLAPDGILLHNEARPILQDVAVALALPFEQSRHAPIASVRGAPAPLADSIFLHRKARDARDDLGFAFTNVAARGGLVATTVSGGRGTNTYLIETTGSGVAALDYDADGWLDIFLVNGSTLEGFPKGQEPTSHLYRNRGDGTFEDVTERAGLVRSGWGQGTCAGDYDNDGFEDLLVTYWGQNRLYRNRGDGAFDDVTGRAGLMQDRVRWGAGCAFLDYDRDGRLDLIAANYVDLDLAHTPSPASGLCRYKGLPVACGPSGLPGGTNVLYRNRGDGTFADVSQPSGIARARGTYGLGVTTVDFDADGWVDVYVANDSNPSTLYRNNHDGTFTDIAIAAGCAYTQDGRAQAGMGVAVGDYDRSGTMDIFKTNFAGDTSTLYANAGNGFCDDRTFAAGIGVNTRWLGWGVGFLDLDGDGWLDLFLVNGHVYPEVDRLESEAGYRQPKVVYRNLGNGRFADISRRLGPPATTPKAARGAAFADFDNDGDVDVVVNNVHDTPDLFRLDRTRPRRWITLKLVGTQSNRSAIGARVRLVTAGGEQRQEVRSGGSYYSQSDLRLHFGLGEAPEVERVVVRWPNGLEEEWRGLAADRAHALTEGTGRALN